MLLLPTGHPMPLSFEPIHFAHRDKKTDNSNQPKLMILDISTAYYGSRANLNPNFVSVWHIVKFRAKCCCWLQDTRRRSAPLSVKLHPLSLDSADYEQETNYRNQQKLMIFYISTAYYG